MDDGWEHGGFDPWGAGVALGLIKNADCLGLEELEESWFHLGLLGQQPLKAAGAFPFSRLVEGRSDYQVGSLWIHPGEIQKQTAKEVLLRFRAGCW